MKKDCLSIQLPGPPAKFDTLNISVYKMQYNSTEYEIVLPKLYLKVESVRTFNSILQGYVDGYTKSKVISHYRNIVSDSVFGGVTGKYIRSVKSDSVAGYTYLYNFVTHVNGHFYSIVVRTDCKEAYCIESVVSPYFHSIQFDPLCRNAKLDEEVLYNSSFAFGHRFGIPILLILLTGVSLFAYMIYKKHK